ncbi:MAG: hypothetical protein II425_01360, partial [Oscillospiraceae bacterium]|nr:hypothetical protein [Oscillospiraceae bacterium]
MEKRKENDIFGGEELCPELCFRLYEKSRGFKSAIDLYDTVNTNENFYIGKQWEGVEANGLPTPVFNFLKKDVMFTVASITSDNIKIQVSPLAAAADSENLKEPARILTEELERIGEENGLSALLRLFARDAAVRGDGCIYTYWDPETETYKDYDIDLLELYNATPREDCRTFSDFNIVQGSVPPGMALVLGPSDSHPDNTAIRLR